MSRLMAPFLFVCGFVIAVFARLEGSTNDVWIVNGASLVIGSGLMVWAIVDMVREQ